MAEEHYILMKDAFGEKATGGLKKMVGINTSNKQILRGEILKPIPLQEIQTRPDGSQPNFCLDRDPNIALHAEADDVSPLGVLDYNLLCAINSTFDRFRVFSDPQWLDYGESLKEGAHVYVRLPSPNTSVSSWSPAVVRYKGPVKALPGTTFGVEIMDEQFRGKGTSNGVFQDYQYFQCDTDCGLFVSLDKVWYTPLPPGIQGELQVQQSTSKQQSYAAAAAVSATQQPRSHKKSQTSDVDPPHVRFKIGDQVVVYDRKDTPLHGIVRWAGRKNRVGRDLGEMHIGIEMAVYVKPSDVPGAKAGLTDLFVAKRNHSIIIPESMVVAQEAYVNTRASKEKKPQHGKGEDLPPYINNPVAIAREHGMTQEEFIEKQKIALKEHETQKLKQDEEKLLRGVKQVAGESLSGDFIAHQQELLDAVKKESQGQSGSVRKVQVQQPSLETNLDVSRRDMKKQHSYQPLLRHDHLYDEIPAKGDRANVHRSLGSQGKSSSVAQGEGISDTFQSESHQHHGIGGIGGFSDDTAAGGGAYFRQPQNWKQVQEHEHSHQDNQYQNIAQLNRDTYGGPSTRDPLPSQSQSGYENLCILPNEMQSQRYDRPSEVHPSTKYPEYSSAMQYPPAHSNLAASTVQPGSGAPSRVLDPNLGIGSRIQIPTQSPKEPFRYGVIRWMGEIPAIQGLVAGIELDEYMEGCTDGTLLSTGQKFFSCIQGRGIYYPVVNLQPDIRFMDPASVVGGENLENPLDDAPLKVVEDQFTEGRHEQIQRYIGDRKGIQGHQNSCYLDASIFGLFALTDAFDEMFLQAQSIKTADQNRQDIAELLWKGIVNPLRKNGVVRYESVMALRTKLDELGKMEGIAHAEKDPEEFLNMLFKHTLKVDPFLTIRRPYGDEPEFFVQLFVEYNESLQLPTIGRLLHTMFSEQKLSFLQMPSRLLIQVPRFGRQFKTYEKIIPDLKLNVSDLTEEYRQAAAEAPRCFVCNERAECLCRQCASEVNKDGYLCALCNKQFHTHPSRSNHVPDQSVGSAMVESTLDLLSVICIETSHYVCFTKEPTDDPNKPPRWIFFDSMANRVYDRFNIPTVTECSEMLNEWVYPANSDLSKLRNTAPRDLPEYVRRFTQDLCLCVYINLDSVLYG